MSANPILGIKAFCLKKKTTVIQGVDFFCPANIGVCEFPLIAIESSEYKGRKHVIHVMFLDQRRSHNAFSIAIDCKGQLGPCIRNDKNETLEIYNLVFCIMSANQILGI